MKEKKCAGLDDEEKKYSNCLTEVLGDPAAPVALACEV